MEKYINYLKRNNYSESTIKTYSSILKSYKSDWDDIRLIKKRLLNVANSPNTISTHYQVILAYMRFTKDKRIENFRQIKLPQISMVYRPVFTKEYVYNRTKTLSDNKMATIRFLFETGIRASEFNNVIGITNETIIIKGKGNKIREIFHQIETTSKIEDWNTSPKTLRVWTKEILGQEFSPHSIRRSHATHLLLNGANPKMVMLQLGHSKIETTYRYLNTSKELNNSIYNKHF